eukprot:1150216-Pelagomonas_calceolata.AAC.1
MHAHQHSWGPAHPGQPPGGLVPQADNIAFLFRCSWEEHQQQKQPRASRGRQRASSSQRPADRRAHAQPESKAEAFDQTRAAAQEVICGWEKTVDACAWCVHVILSRLAYPLPYPCMAGFLPLATGTMQVLSQPGSFRMRGLLRPHDTRSANPGEVCAVSLGCLPRCAVSLGEACAAW